MIGRKAQPAMTNTPKPQMMKTAGKRANTTFLNELRSLCVSSNDSAAWNVSVSIDNLNDCVTRRISSSFGPVMEV